MYRESAYFLRPGVMIMPIVLMEQMKSDVEHLGKIKLVVGEEMVRFLGIFNLGSILKHEISILKRISIKYIYYLNNISEPDFVPLPTEEVGCRADTQIKCPGSTSRICEVVLRNYFRF